jgi:hypothetical protein
MGPSPYETEAGLDGGAEISLGGGGFIQEQSEINRHNPPDKPEMLEGRCQQGEKDRPIMVHVPTEIRISVSTLKAKFRSSPLFAEELI